MTKLNDLQLDVLAEALNIGMGAAAASLSDMLGSSVGLSAPRIEFMTRGEAVLALNRTGAGPVCGVSQGFEGNFSGESMLLFPIDKSLELVRLLMKETLPLEGLTELEEEALSEVGNIILNAVIGSLAELFAHDIGTDLPSFKQGSFEDVLVAACDHGKDSMVLLLRVDFNVEQSEIDGYVVFVLDLASISGLANGIDGYMRKLGIAEV